MVVSFFHASLHRKQGLSKKVGGAELGRNGAGALPEPAELRPLLFFPCHPRNREHYFPVTPNTLPVRRLFGAQPNFLIKHLKTNDFRKTT
jgi:hypothetical protein